jgi:hypothetical protein
VAAAWRWHARGAMVARLAVPGQGGGHIRAPFDARFAGLWAESSLVELAGGGVAMGPVQRRMAAVVRCGGFWRPCVAQLMRGRLGQGGTLVG